jgi:UDP-N-acetyl-2-amino-2-deoxyglucuronate dehydrogenase
MDGYKNNKKIGFALVGTGWIAPYHIDAINSNQDARLIGVFSNNKTRGKKFAQQNGIKHYESYLNMLKDDEVDVVDIVTYNYLHADLAIKAINYDKHVIVEKPIDIDIKKAEILVKLANEKKRKLSCVSEFRFSKGITEFKTLIDKNILGTVHLINISMPLHRNDNYFLNSKWRGCKNQAGGGVLIMNVIHIIDILIWIFGPIISVNGRKTIVRKNIVNVEDSIGVLLEFENGLKSVISATNVAKETKPIRMEVYGTKNTVIVEDFCITDKSINKIAQPLGKKVLKKCFFYQIKDMIDSIKNNRKPLTNGEAGLIVLQTIDQIYKSC